VKIVEEKKIIVFSSFLSAILIMTMILTKNSYVFLIVGLFMGAIFPVIQRYANMNLNKNEVGLLNGVTYGSTGIGGMIFSYFMGLISKKSIPLMFILPIIGLILVGFLQLFERRRVNT
jgi:fucose permease